MKHGLLDLPVGGAFRWSLGLVALIAVIAYALFQGRFLIEGPVLSLSGEPPRATGDGTVEIVGSAENIASLSLNGRTIYTNDDGSFEETITLENGYTIMTLEAIDRYGNRERLERGIVKRQTEEGVNISIVNSDTDYGEEKGEGESGRI